MPLRPLRAREIIRKLERAGFVLRRQRGSHARYVHPDGRGATVPMHSGDVPVPVIRSILGQTGLSWTDADRVHRLITQDIPTKVAADTAYQNAQKHSDKQNARIEHDKALGRVMTSVLKDDTELFRQFSDNESFRRWLTDTVFGLTYEQPRKGGEAHP